MKKQILKRLVLLSVLIILLSCTVGCDDITIKDGQLPSEINTMKPPIIMLACNDEGVILIDSTGLIGSWNEGYYFAQTLIKEGYSKGDTLVAVSR